MTATEHSDALLEALRRNLHVLNELAVRYEVETDPGRADEGPAITSPEDVHRLLGAEMGALCQEQVRVLLLDRRNRVVGQRVIYQGNAFSTVVRPAEVLGPAVVEGVPNLIVAHNHPSGRPLSQPPGHQRHEGAQAGGEAARPELLDHVVIGASEAVSLKDRGLLD